MQRDSQGDSTQSKLPEGPPPESTRVEGSVHSEPGPTHEAKVALGPPETSEPQAACSPLTHAVGTHGKPSRHCPGTGACPPHNPERQMLVTLFTQRKQAQRGEQLSRGHRSLPGRTGSSFGVSGQGLYQFPAPGIGNQGLRAQCSPPLSVRWTQPPTLSCTLCPLLCMQAEQMEQAMWPTSPRD